MDLKANNHIPEVSIVIPIYNEDENIPELYKRLTDVMARLFSGQSETGKVMATECGKHSLQSKTFAEMADAIQPLEENYEIIMVDDGSIDHSWELIQELHQSDPRVKGLSFSRNFGHHIAITAGLDHAKGRAVILMDGDLQDPPEEIPKLYRKFKEGYDVVYAIRGEREDPVFKRATSWIFLRFLKKISQVEINLQSGIFRILSKRCVENMSGLREKSRLIVGLINWIGYPQTGVITERDQRYGGKSKYSLFKLFKLAWHGVTSFSYIPLQVATYFGFSVAAISFLMGIYMLCRKMFLGVPILGYASIIVSLFFLGGVILLVLGVIGEYIGRIYTEVQNRPLYVIKEETAV
jgi:glycosyltransferase involved in cell wall biosynthesis